MVSTQKRTRFRHTLSAPVAQRDPLRHAERRALPRSRRRDDTPLSPPRRPRTTADRAGRQHSVNPPRSTRHDCRSLQSGFSPRRKCMKQAGGGILDLGTSTAMFVALVGVIGWVTAEVVRRSDPRRLEQLAAVIDHVSTGSAQHAELQKEVDRLALRIVPPRV